MPLSKKCSRQNISVLLKNKRFGMSSSFPQLSIMVAVFNGEKILPQFFNCLHAQQLENLGTYFS